MKVAITSTGKGTESILDRHFGRCAFFVIYDTLTGGLEILPNPNRDTGEGAGQASVRLLDSRNVKMIVTGEFGVKIKTLIDSLKIQMVIYNEPDKSVQSVIDMLNRQ
jgi:predicted Fe-Mo cluster-binding NifX family protein